MLKSMQIYKKNIETFSDLKVLQLINLKQHSLAHFSLENIIIIIMLDLTLNWLCTVITFFLL